MPRFFAALAPCGQPATPSHSLARSGGKWQQPTDPREAVIGADEPLISLHYLILSYHIMQCTPVRPFRYRHVQVQYVRLAANGGAAEWGQTGPVICGLASPRTRTCVVPCSRDCRLAASRGSGRWRESWTRRAPVRLVASRRPYRTLAVLEGPGAHRPKRPKRSPRGRHCEALRLGSGEVFLSLTRAPSGVLFSLAGAHWGLEPYTRASCVCGGWLGCSRSSVCGHNRNRNERARIETEII